jgi:ABC-type dipeptide/oligopeptide/nickel transport system ATPase component
VPELRIGWLEDSLSRRELLSDVEGKVQSAEIGCPFFGRCPLAIPGTCDTETPPDRQIGVKHVVSCWREPAELPV